MSHPDKKRRGYVAVAGTIGAGKTSLVEWLARRYDLVPFYEPQDVNPYLADFYADMKRWAFHSQMAFLAHKLDLHVRLAAHGERAILDRTLYEDAEIFAKNLRNARQMSKRDFDVYWKLYEGIKSTLPPPRVLVALTCTMRTAKRRIAKRGRAMEKAIPDAYLRRLHALYADWFSRYDLSPVVHVATDDMDYVENLVDLIDLTSKLDKHL